MLSFDLANLDRDRRFNNLTGEGDTLWIVVGLVAAGVAICLLADCFEGDDEDDSVKLGAYRHQAGALLGRAAMSGSTISNPGRASSSPTGRWRGAARR